MNVNLYIRQKQEELVKERLGNVSYSSRVELKDICRFLLSTGFSIKEFVSDEVQFDLFCSTYLVGKDVLRKKLINGNFCIYYVCYITEMQSVYNGISFVFEGFDKVGRYDGQQQSDLVNYDEWSKNHYDMFFINLQPIIT